MRLTGGNIVEKNKKKQSDMEESGFDTKMNTSERKS